MLRDGGGAAKSSSPKKIFTGVRFVLFGFDSVSEAQLFLVKHNSTIELSCVSDGESCCQLLSEAGPSIALITLDDLNSATNLLYSQYRSELVDGGGVDVGRYDSSCTHVIVSGRVFDDPVCVAARNDGKILVTELWIDDSLAFGMLADSTKVLYMPPRDLSGIPGSDSLHICLTGYQRQERDDIMRMVSLMGGRFSKPLIANQVTHLICYKFEGEKYELARKVNIKLVNHRWLEDCLKAWEILPINSYNKSGWELEMLEAEAMDSEQETEEAGKMVTDQRFIAESSVRGEMSVAIGSGSLVDSKNLGLKNNSLTAKPSDLAVNNQLLSTPHKENCSAKATHVCETMSEALGVNRGIAEQLPVNLRSSLVGMASCEEDIKLASLESSRRTAEKVVSPKDQFKNLCTPHKGEPGEVNKGDVSISSAELMDEVSKKCINDNFCSSMTSLRKPYVEGQTYALPNKRKLSVSKISSKSIKSDQDSKISGLLGPQKSINSAEHDFLKPHQRELENALAHNEASMRICDLVEKNDEFSTCRRSLELAQHDSGTYIRQSPTSIRSRQIESMNAPHSEIGHGLTNKDGFEGTSFVQPGANQRGSLSKSSSRTFKRKFPKHLHSASVANISPNSSSMSDNKDELLSVPSMPTLDGTICTTYEPVSGVGISNGITSEAMVLSDYPLNNETRLGEDKSTGNDQNFQRSSLSGDGGSVNEPAPVSVTALEVPLKRTRKSEAVIKSQNFDSVSKKCQTDIHNEAPQQHGGPGEDISKDSTVKGSVSAEISGSCKEGKENDVSIHCNRKALVSRNMGCRPKPSRKNCKNKSSSDSLRSINSNKTAIELGNVIVALGDVDNLKEKVEKEGSPMKEKGNVEQCYPPARNSDVITLDTNHLIPEKENELKDSCNLLVKEDNCGQKAKKICKSNIRAKRSSGDEINSLPKLNSLSVLIEPMWFILSGHQTQKKEFQKIIKRLRGRICKDSHSWSYEATHFVVPDYVRRTQKFFAAAAAGRWILKPDYLTASDEAGKFLNEEPFEWHKKGLTEDGAISLEAPRKWRTLRERTGHGAFYGMCVIIYGDCIAPPLDTLKRAVKAGDGTILATSPPYTRFLNSDVDFAIVNASVPVTDAWIQEFLRHKIPCILSDYLVEYVCKPGYSLDRHVLHSTHRWAEKSLANLVRRSEVVVSDDDGSGDVRCVVCGSPGREEVMLICGDEGGTRGCGVGTHIDCCDPPLARVPEGDWFCSGGCSGKIGRKAKQAETNKVKRRKSK